MAIPKIIQDIIQLEDEKAAKIELEQTKEKVEAVEQDLEATKEDLVTGLASKASAYKKQDGYDGIVLNDGTDAGWIRTTKNGLIPYDTNATSSLGTKTYPFKNVYAKEVIATTFTGNLNGTAKKATTADNAATLSGKSLDEIITFASANSNSSGKRIYEFNGTLTIPDNVRCIIVTACAGGGGGGGGLCYSSYSQFGGTGGAGAYGGGGGGGGSTISSYYCGGGGAGGCYIYKILFPVNPGEKYNIYVGEGGNGGKPFEYKLENVSDNAFAGHGSNGEPTYMELASDKSQLFYLNGGKGGKGAWYSYPDDKAFGGDGGYNTENYHCQMGGQGGAYGSDGESTPFATGGKSNTSGGAGGASLGGGGGGGSRNSTVNKGGEINYTNGIDFSLNGYGEDGKKASDNTAVGGKGGNGVVIIEW